MTIRNPVQNSALNPIYGPLSGRGGQTLLEQMDALNAAGDFYAWMHLQDTTAIFLEAAKSTNVSADGQTIAVIEDRAGNSDWLQSTEAQEPEWNTDGGLQFWLDYAGTKTIGIGTLSSAPSDCSIFAAINTTGNVEVLFNAFNGTVTTNNSGYYVYGGIAGHSSGSETYYIDGSAIGSTRGDLYAAITGGAYHTVEARGVDLSSWTGFYPSGFSTGRVTGLMPDIIIIPTANLTTAKRTTIINYLKQQVGLA